MAWKVQVRHRSRVEVATHIDHQAAGRPKKGLFTLEGLFVAWVGWLMTSPARPTTPCPSSWHSSKQQGYLQSSKGLSIRAQHRYHSRAPQSRRCRFLSILASSYHSKSYFHWHWSCCRRSSALMVQLSRNRRRLSPSSKQSNLIPHLGHGSRTMYSLASTDQL